MWPGPRCTLPSLQGPAHLPMDVCISCQTRSCTHPGTMVWALPPSFACFGRRQYLTSKFPSHLDLGRVLLVHLRQWLSARQIWFPAPRGHLAILGDVLAITPIKAGNASGIRGVEAKDAAKHPMGHRTAPPQRMTRLECQQSEVQNPYSEGIWSSPLRSSADTGSSAQGSVTVISHRDTKTKS